MLFNRTERDIHADVERREPEYTTPPDYPIDPLPEAVGQHDTTVVGLTELPRGGRRVPFAGETRKLVVVEYGQQAGQVTLDGTGYGTVDFGTVPSNEYWLLDNVVGRAGAAGNVHVYERGSTAATNPLDLVAAMVLSAPAFTAMAGPSETRLAPGSHVIGEIVGGGAAALASLKIMYRVAILVVGSQEVKP